MSTARYIGALVLGGIILIAGIILPCVYLKGQTDMIILCCVSAYGVAATATNLVWFEGPSAVIAAFGFRLVGTIITWVLSLLASVLGWLLLIFFGSFIVGAAVAIIGITLAVVVVVSCVMLPINAVIFAKDLY